MDTTTTTTVLASLLAVPYVYYQLDQEKKRDTARKAYETKDKVRRLGKHTRYLIFSTDRYREITESNLE